MNYTHSIYINLGHWASMSAKGCLLDSLMPPTFQRLMETCLGDLNRHWCIIYLDDIVIFSKALASNLQKLEEAGLKLKPSKCELFQWQITYSGHMISVQGVATDEDPNKCHKGPKFSRISGILPSVYP